MRPRAIYKLSPFFFLLTLLLAHAVQAQSTDKSCDGSAFEKSATAMRAARVEAMKIEVTWGSETDVSPEAIKQIQEFKNDLFSALQMYFVCQSGRLTSAAAIEKDLYKRLGLAVPPPKDATAADDGSARGPWTGLYLGRVELEVKRIPDARQLISVMTIFSVPFGRDAELDVFAPGQDKVWRPSIHFTSRPYNRIDGAFLGLDYKISPPDDQGKWFLVADHVNPWPTSCWQSLFVDAMRPTDYGGQDEFFHHTSWGYLCDGEGPYLRSVEVDRFQIRFSIPSLDEGRGSSISVMTYLVAGDEVTRVQPVALNPVNFVDEWGRSPWKEARDWSKQSNWKQLEREHRLTAQGGDFVTLRRCGTSLSEVELSADMGDGRSRFFLVRTRAGQFEMLSVSAHPTASCSRKNLLATISIR